MLATKVEQGFGVPGSLAKNPNPPFSHRSPTYELVSDEHTAASLRPPAIPLRQPYSDQETESREIVDSLKATLGLAGRWR